MDEPFGCPFCAPEILEGEFAGNDVVAAIYNIAPFLPGHSLVIPRQHLESLAQLDAELMGQLFSFASRVAACLTGEFDTDAFDLTLQEGAAAGQTVSHLHLHVIPRISGDLAGENDWHDSFERHKEEIETTAVSRPQLSDPGAYHKVVRRLRSAAGKCGLPTPIS